MIVKKLIKMMIEGILKRTAHTMSIKVPVTIRLILLIWFKLDRGRNAITLFTISDDGATTFVLTHADMMLEMKELKAARAHGTQALVNNENIEYRMTLHKDSADWDRWINNYYKEGDSFQS